jgi:glutathione S-transferase
MITLHHLENSRSQRIVWLLEVLQLEYDIKKYKRDPKTGLAPKDLRKISSLGKSPVMEIDGEILPESGAIFQYLLTKYDTEFNWHPKTDSPSYKDFNFWLHFAEGSLMPPLVMKFIFSTIETKVPFFIRPLPKLIFKGIDIAYLDHTLRYILEFIEKHLTTHQYFLGEKFSAVDIMMSFPLEALASSQIELSAYPNIRTHVQNLKTREDYKKALKVGGEYAY